MSNSLAIQYVKSDSTTAQDAVGAWEGPFDQRKVISMGSLVQVAVKLPYRAWYNQEKTLHDRAFQQNGNNKVDPTFWFVWGLARDWFLSHLTGRIDKATGQVAVLVVKTTENGDKHHPMCTHKQTSRRSRQQKRDRSTFSWGGWYRLHLHKVRRRCLVLKCHENSTRLHCAPRFPKWDSGNLTEFNPQITSHNFLTQLP